MKLRSENESAIVEPVDKLKKIVPKKVKSSSVKQHQSKIRQINHNKRPNEINKLQSKLKNVCVVLNRIVLNADQQDQQNQLKFNQAYELGRKRTMTDHLKPVESLSLEGNVSENWRIFKRNYDIFAIAKGLDEKTDVIKVNTFLNAIGKDAVEVFDSFNLTGLERTLYASVVKAFEDFCKPKKNVVYERYKFGIRNQKPGEPFDIFLLDIKKLARYCEFAEQDNMIRDRIVIGMTDSKLRERLLSELNLTMEKAIEKARASEVSKAQAESMNNGAAEINEIGNNSKHTNQSKAHGQQSNNKHKQNNNSQNSQNRQQQQRQRNAQSSSGNNNNNSKSNQASKQQQKEIKNCTRCGYSHKTRECPAYGKQCRSCGKQNHYSSMCKQRAVATIETHTDSEGSSEYFIGILNTFDETSSETADSITFPWLESIKMNEKKVDSKIDTGADMDVMPLNVLRKIAPNTELRATSVTLRAFGGQKIKPTGMCTLLLSFNGISFKKNFAVVDLDFVPIIGLRTSIRLGIVQPTSVYKNRSKKSKQL